jgi:hypothetical protein
MRRDGYSKFRILLFVVLVATILFGVSGSFAQNASPAGGKDEAAPSMFTTLITLILSHVDMVFVIIIGCSITAVTLIVKGFIQARASVLLPPRQHRADSRTHRRQTVPRA